jgi:HEAT repeat protein
LENCNGRKTKVEGRKEMNAMRIITIISILFFSCKGFSVEHNNLTKALALLEYGTEQQKKNALSSLWILEYPKYRKNNHVFDPILNAMIKDKSPFVREAAAACLKRIGNYSKGCCLETNIVPSLIMALRDSSPRVRAEAAKALAYYRDKRAVFPLTESLRDTDPWVRLNAAFALGEQAAFKGLAPLHAMLSDNSDWRFRFCNREAEMAIRRLRTRLTFKINEKNIKFYGKFRFEEDFSSQEEMITFLIEQLEDREMRVRSAALNSLGYYHDPRLLDIYAKFLKDGPNQLRWIAVVNVRDCLKSAQNLGEITHKNIVELLIPLLAVDKEPNRPVVAEIFGMIGDKKAVLPLIHTLSDWTKPEIKEGDNGLRIKIVEALGKIGDKRAYDALVRTLNASLTYRKNDIELKRASIKSLGLIKDNRAVPLLIDLLSDRSAKYGVIEAFGHIKDERAFKSLLDTLHERDHSRLYAIKSLGMLRDKRAIKPLLKIVGERFGDFFFVEDALKEYNDSEMVNILVDALKDDSPDIRKGALVMLGRFGDKKEIDKIKPFLTDKDPQIKLSAKFAISQINRSVPVH